jgi:outer membrane lipoprotein-sorting protein
MVGAKVMGKVGAAQNASRHMVLHVTFRLARSRTVAMAMVALFAAAIPTTRTSATTDDVFARSRAVYASLRSYADTGTIDKYYGAHDYHTFRTYFTRTPRRFYFEFNKLGNVDHLVIWADPDAFHSWWKGIGVKSDFPNPNNTNVFVGAGDTSGAAMQITPLLYSKAGLPGALANFRNATVSGTEAINGRPCYRVVGTTSDFYGGTGREVNVRNMTVWIDIESLLVRKIHEVPKTQVPGHNDYVTTTFVPQANPAIDDRRFRFTPPSK